MTQPATIAPDAATSGPPRSIKYGVLTQRHPECDPARYETIEDLYRSGFDIQKKADKYLDKHLLEHPQRYSARIKTASYQPFFGQIVDQFVADLFTQPLNITPAGDANKPNTPGEYPDQPFYAQLAKDVDGEGTPIESLAADLLTTALKHRRAYLMVDAPAIDVLADNLADEEAVGARRCYAYEVPPSQVIDWCADKRGAFQWVVLAERSQERESPLSDRSIIRETFTVWTIGADGDAEWARYAVSYKPTEAPTADREILLDDAGLTSFKRIPLLRLELPFGLWVGNKIGPQALEHWRRRSELLGAQSVSCVAIPYANLGPEIPAAGEGLSETQTDPDRGRDPVRQFEAKGFLALGHQDKLGFAEPEGKAYEIIDKQLDGLRESMYAVNHQMAASVRPTHSALGRSGLSKQKDQNSTNKVLGALGRCLRQFFVGFYDTISRARGEDVVWVAHGLDSYETDDRQEVLEESLQLEAVNIPSPTFRKEHAKRVAAKLVPNLPPETVSQIASEIDGGIDEQQEMRSAENEAKREAIDNPPADEAKTPAPPAKATGAAQAQTSA